MAIGGILARNTDGSVTQTGPGTATHVLTSNGAGAVPTFQATATTGITQLTGNVTAGPGTGSQVATIAADAVTFAKMQNIATQTAVGRNTAATGDPESVTISQMMDWGSY